MTTQSPTLRWSLDGGLTTVHVSVCQGPFCQKTVFDQDVTGTSIKLPQLAPGSYHWRIYIPTGSGHAGSGGTGTNIPASPPGWEFFVGDKDSPVDGSYGSIFDVRDDGYADLVIGAPGTPDVGNGPAIVGSVDLYLLGGQEFPVTPTTLTDPGNNPSDFFGQSIASAGDVDGDGCPELLVGAPGDNTPGVVYVYFGSYDGDLQNPTFVLDDPATNPLDGFGSAVAGVGDVDGDGYADILVGTGPGSTSTYLYLGKDLRSGKVNPVTIPNTVGNASAQGLAGVGDVNGDGFADAMIGPSLYLGSSSGLSAPVTLPAPSGANGFGGTVAGAGDVNGDGYTDVLVGSVSDLAFVYLGSASGLQPTPITLSGITLGRALAGAGDVNGDGYGDVVLGALGPGQAYLFLGGPGGPGGTPTVVGGGGQVVAGAGDVNADGFADFLVCPGAGSVDLFLGSASTVQSSLMTFNAPSNSGYFGASAL